MTQRFETEQDALRYIFSTRDALPERSTRLDEFTRDPSPTRRIMLRLGLPTQTREYMVITGSKGKGSTAAISARLLQELGHTVGLLTSPHLTNWYERIRVNGQAIPQADFLRILSEFAPAIDKEVARLNPGQYISPQGFFLLIALRYFDERGVDATVLEVGRGGRFDDVALVPNKLSLFTPIIMEHTQYLGDSLERIAWHKSGIISQGSYVYSVPQAPEVMRVLTDEADARDAEFYWLSVLDMPEYLGETPTGQRMRLQRYGECELSLLGRYQLQNAALAVQGVGNMHARLQGISHSSPEYVERIRTGLSNVRWPGRLHVLQQSPQVILDGAINPRSARDFMASVQPRLTRPVVTIAGVPRDRDYPGVYAVLAEYADALILTETSINPNIHFPYQETALTAARRYHDDVQYAPNLSAALLMAYARAGVEGTILLSVAQPLVGEAIQRWQIDMNQI